MTGSTILNSGCDSMLAKGDQIFEFIPQRPPMVMIDELFEVTGARFISGLSIDAGNIFVTRGLLREPGIIENIAQTAAAGVGYYQKSKGKPVTLGFIAAIRNLEIKKLPSVGLKLVTNVEIVNEVLEMTIINGAVRVNEDLIANCEMRIFINF